jgi:putative polyhydroxyalkanoate system protein
LAAVGATMSRLTLSVTTPLDVPTCRARLAAVQQQLASRYGAQCEWRGDQLLITHAQLNGQIALAPGQIQVDAKLGFPLALMHGKIAQELQRLLHETVGS